VKRRARTARDLAGKLLRVSAYVFALTLVLGVVGARRAQAQAKEGALLVGEQLLRLAESDEGNTARELSINGQSVHISSAHTSLPLGVVLDRFQKTCEDHADGMVKELADLEGSLARPAVLEGFPGVGVLRDDRGGRGVVACFAAGQALDTAGLFARLQRFASSHDFTDLGDLRYVAARTLDSGATEVVASWTSGRFRLDEMFPEHGDAAGDDPHAAPRPASARRILSAHDVRAPYGVFLYEMPGTAAGALSAYAVDARSGGWTRHETVTDRDADVAAFERNGIDLLVTAEALEGGQALVSIVEMPAPFAGKDKR